MIFRVEILMSNTQRKEKNYNYIHVILINSSKSHNYYNVIILITLIISAVI